jgi:hypothetical protein
MDLKIENIITVPGTAKVYFTDVMVKFQHIFINYNLH